LQEALEEQVAKLSAVQKPGDSNAISEELTKKHAADLKAIEDKLQAQFEIDKQKAVDDAIATAAKDGSSPQDSKAAIDAALAEQEKKFQETLTEEKNKAMESGRHEAQMKGRIKDQQLARANGKLKEYEKLVDGLVSEGKIPAPTFATGTPAKPAAKPATTTTTTVPPQAGPSTPITPTTATSAATPTNVAAKTTPGPALRALPGRPPVTQNAVRGGVGRGGASIRGAATRGRGGGPLHTAAVAAASANNKTPLSGGVTIQGAAKRPREEAAGASEDASLAKRLKPAGAGGPVQIKRPPPAS
jgi:nucleoprotein TPR